MIEHQTDKIDFQTKNYQFDKPKVLLFVRSIKKALEL